MIEDSVRSIVLPLENSTVNAHPPSESGSKENPDPASEIVNSLFCPMVRPMVSIENFAPVVSTRVICTESPSAHPAELRYPVCNCEPSRRQASNIQNATACEISFIHYTSMVGLVSAIGVFKKMGGLRIMVCQVYECPCERLEHRYSLAGFLSRCSQSLARYCGHSTACQAANSLVPCCSCVSTWKEVSLTRCCSRRTPHPGRLANNRST